VSDFFPSANPNVQANLQPAPFLVWTVSALVRAVADALASRFALCSVRGELSGFSRAASGHCYFNLKDADGGDALVRCAMFRRASSLLDFQPQDGHQVQLRGRLVVYEPRGELQLVVESMQRSGEGALMEQFLRLKAKLQAQGLFEAARKRSLPVFPRAVGVVTSLGAAALHDVASSLARRAPHVYVVVYPCLVQGPQAPGALVQALSQASERREVDALILCRGGGSLEDLWAFNDEAVVRAVAACSVPVVSGVGHETDVTLVDFAADLRAPTPTAAAELVAPATRELHEVLIAQAAHMRRAVRQHLDRQAQRLDRAALPLSRPVQVVRLAAMKLQGLARQLVAARAQASQHAAQQLAHTVGRLQHAQQQEFRLRGHTLANLGVRLAAVDPQKVLQRGYAWISDQSGAAVQSVQSVQVHQQLRAVWADGQAQVQVTQVERDAAD
jgi:exodeoxyribonuclease VII large subunit